MDILEILQLLNKGTAMQCCKGRKEPFKKLFCLKLETMDIQQFPITSSQSKKPPQPEEYGMSFWGNTCTSCIIFSHTAVSAREIKEVRFGCQSREFNRSKEEMKKFGIDPACCFVILYGQEFKLKTMSLVGK